MKKPILSTAILLIVCNAALHAQLNVGSAAAPNANAMLQISSATKGVLLPKVALVSTTSASPLSAHVNGMFVMDTATSQDVTPGIYYNDGTKWNRSNTAPNYSYQATNGMPTPGNPTGTAGTIYIDTLGQSMVNPTNTDLGKQYIWNGSSYVSYTSSANSTEFYMGNNVDAGGNKTTAIYRNGAITLNSTTGLQGAVLGPDGGIHLWRKTSGTTPQTNGYLDFSTAPFGTFARLQFDSLVGTKGAFQLVTTTDGNFLDAGTITPLSILNSNGNVGIGPNNSTPTAQLDVLVPNVANNLDFSMTTAGGGATRFISALTAGGYNPISLAGDRGMFFSNNQTIQANAGGFVIAPWSNTAGGIKILSNGNVGIGAATPVAKLQVAGDFTNSSSSAINNIAPLSVGSNSVDGIYMQGGSDGAIIVQRSTNTNLFLAKNTALGNVAAPFINFSVNGSTVGSIVTNGTTTSYNTTSDVRLKDNIAPTAYGLHSVMKMKVYDYNYKKNDTKTLHTGFLAQDLYTVFPSAVTPGGDNADTNPWTVDYSKVVPVLTKAIQEQQSEIRELKEEVEALKAKSSN